MLSTNLDPQIDIMVYN